MNDYRKQIIETINNLIEAREIIFEQILNLAMTSEYKQLDNTFNIGDTYSFSLEHFEGMDDVNVQNLIELCKNTENSINTLMNLNDIKDDEVNLSIEQ